MMRPVRSARNADGYTLISMMVGLVISLLTIAAMLAVYKMMIEVSGRATSDSLRDGQVASGLLAAQMELHNAGYGIDLGVTSTSPADQAKIDSVVAVDAGDKRKVAWRYLDSSVGAERCAGLEIVPDDAGGVAMYLFAPSVCASPASFSWGGDRSLLVSYAQPWVDRDGVAVESSEGGLYLGMEGDDADSGFSLLHEEADVCTLPYAQQDVAAVTSRAPRLLLEVEGRLLFSVCLSNVVIEEKVIAAGGMP